MDQFEVVADSVAYIEAHLTENLFLDDLASRYHFSKYYFHRLFSAVTGSSLNQYVLDRKMNYAVNLIQESNWTFTEIAHQLNFSSSTAFSRAFKSRYQITPSELRKNPDLLETTEFSQIVKRPLKHLNGDIVTDFTLTHEETFKVSGLVFRIDITQEDYIQVFELKFAQLMQALGQNVDQTPGYVIYSDCSEDQKQFNVIIGVKGVFNVDLPYFFTVDVPEMLVARFRYSGNLYYMDEVLNSDLARFLRVTRKEYQEDAIRMIQRFEDISDLSDQYELFVQIKENELDQV